MKDRKNETWLNKAEKVLSESAFTAAKIFANTACFGPYFEPKQPQELERLKSKGGH